MGSELFFKKFVPIFDWNSNFKFYERNNGNSGFKFVKIKQKN